MWDPFVLQMQTISSYISPRKAAPSQPSMSTVINELYGDQEKTSLTLKFSLLLHFPPDAPVRSLTLVTLSQGAAEAGTAGAA